MNEEVYTKISVPLISDKELEIFDSNIHNIIEEYSKLALKEKDQILTQRIIIKQEKEIERLNNIIDCMEKFFKYAYDNEVRPLNDRKISVWTICLDKLQELKEKKDERKITKNN